MSNKRGQWGFTLLEVNVALAILAICLAAILRIYSSATQAARLTDDYYTALQIAETQLALRTAEENPVGSDSGTVRELYRWQVRVEEYRAELDNPLFANRDPDAPEADWVPYHYQVKVSWGESKPRNLELSTIRLGAKW